MLTEAPILEITNLQTSFKTDDGSLTAVSGIDLSIHRGETVALVGESGCGKSVTSLSIMRLLNNVDIRGSIRFDGRDILSLSSSEMAQLRGNEISMIFQEPMTALNPVLTIGDQLGEPLRLHEKLSKRQIKERILVLLQEVGIARASQIIQEYPHQLSGGMRQRIMIAMAMACRPQLLIADEPTTALDVTVQAQILDLLQHLKEENDMALLLITHDLGVVAEVCNRAAVMYAGKIVEEADIDTLFFNPRHPYTIGLLSSMPSIHGTRERLRPILGTVPSLSNMPRGCRFAPRCSHAMDVCRQLEPQLQQIGDQHRVSCWLVEESEHG